MDRGNSFTTRGCQHHKENISSLPQRTLENKTTRGSPHRALKPATQSLSSWHWRSAAFLQRPDCAREHATLRQYLRPQYAGKDTPSPGPQKGLLQSNVCCPHSHAECSLQIKVRHSGNREDRGYSPCEVEPTELPALSPCRHTARRNQKTFAPLEPPFLHCP